VGIVSRYNVFKNCSNSSLFSDMGTTPLHIAVARNHINVVHLLLRRGADMHAQDLESGWSPLHIALYHGFVSVASLLLKHGAKLDPSEIENQDAFTMTKKKKNSLGIDKDGNSPLDLLSLNLKEDIPKAAVKESKGGELYTFGKSDYQLGYVSGLKGEINCYSR
jgi:ankyrin repeat protein